MKTAEIKKFIVRFKAQLGKVKKDSPKGCKLRSTIGGLLVETGDPHMDMSLEHCGYVLDYYDVSKKQLGIDIQNMSKKFAGMVSDDIIIQSIVGKYIAGEPIESMDVVDDEEDDEEIEDEERKK